MNRTLKDLITIESCDLYIAMIYFLEKYNEDLQSQDIKDLLGELEQFHIAQWAFKEWQNILKATLIEAGAPLDSEMHDMNTTHRWQFK